MKTVERLLILLLLVGMACGQPPRVQDLIPQTSAKEYKLVVTDVAQLDDAFDRRWKPFYRSGDERIPGSINILISGSRVCVVPMRVWALRPIGTAVTCDWRTAHSTNRAEPIFRS